MNFFRFKVTYWSTFDARNETDCGFVFAEKYAGAAEKIEQWYGNDLISIDLLYELENDIVLLDEKIRETWDVEQ